MRKITYLFNKIVYNNGIFHAKMGTIKDRNGKDLTETEGIKRVGKNTQTYTKKILIIWMTTMVWSLI